jgi:hypothetical protein
MTEEAMAVYEQGRMGIDIAEADRERRLRWAEPSFDPNRQRQVADDVGPYRRRCC